MHCLSGLITLLLAASTCGYVVKKYNDHCNGIECPKYDVTDKTDDYEVRRYPAYKWAAARQQGLDYSDASRANFGKLFAYIQGANEQKTKIAMTAPVLTHLTVTQGPFCAADFTMHFFVPYTFQSNPPKPNNDTNQVHIVELPEMDVYVRSYGGFSSESKVQQNALALAKSLQRDGIEFDQTQYLTANYDSPFKLFNRHNEVLFYAKKK